MAEKQPPTATRVSQRLEQLLGGENVYLLVLAGIVGILGGFGAVLFREMIELFRSLAFPGGALLEELAKTPWYMKVIPPAAGGLIVGPLVYFWAREAKGHGIPEVMNAVSNHGGRIRRRVMAVKILASAITIGTGGSVGREGPIGQIGAGLGSSLGQMLGFEGNRLVILLGCGAAAGMAATFNAPIGGVILAVEVIIGSASVSVFSPLVVSSVMGTIVSRMWFGDEPAFINVPAYSLVSVVELPLYIGLGVLAGLVALVFTRGICLIEDLWEKVPIPEWFTPVVGGAMIGGIAIFFPHVLGVGYETIDIALQSKGTFVMLLGLVFIKIIATGITLGSGGSGGIFAPSLFVGACLGGAFGMVMEQLLPGQTAHPGAYALVGMGAVVAGTTHAPITAIIMLFELTSDYEIILPLMLSCIISVVLASKVMPASIYTIKLLRRGEHLRSSSESELMRTTKVRRILRPFPETLEPGTSIKEVMHRAIGDLKAHQYVVDENGVLLGVITLAHLKTVYVEQDLDEQLVVAADVMKTSVVSVTFDDTLDVAMSHISRLDTEMLPVVNDKGQIAGSVTRHDMMLFFEHEILKNKGLGLKFVPEADPDDAEFIEVPEGHVVDMIKVTGFLNGQTLRQLDLRATAGLNVLGIRRNTHDGIKRIAPDPGQPLVKGEVLIVVGERKAIAGFKKAIS
ncbi:MAG: CBS domain-containing protein [Proteobacteria bacterium]|nr:CBS domain-containing protein [Pseudomonadota bacterium]